MRVGGALHLHRDAVSSRWLVDESVITGLVTQIGRWLVDESVITGLVTQIGRWLVDESVITGLVTQIGRWLVDESVTTGGSGVDEDLVSGRVLGGRLSGGDVGHGGSPCGRSFWRR